LFWRKKKQREENMNTISIVMPESNDTVTYNESEVLRFIQSNTELKRQVDELQTADNHRYITIRDIRNNVRDFFSEGEWSDNEQTVNKSEVNLLLETIGTNKLTSKYRGTFTVTGTFNVEVEDEDDVTDVVTDGISVDFYGGDIDVEQIDVLDIEEDD
jgi:hypothetical protein